MLSTWLYQPCTKPAALVGSVTTKNTTKPTIQTVMIRLST